MQTSSVAVFYWVFKFQNSIVTLMTKECPLNSEIAEKVCNWNNTNKMNWWSKLVASQRNSPTPKNAKYDQNPEIVRIILASTYMDVERIPGTNHWCFGSTSQAKCIPSKQEKFRVNIWTTAHVLDASEQRKWSDVKLDSHSFGLFTFVMDACIITTPTFYLCYLKTKVTASGVSKIPSVVAI